MHNITLTYNNNILSPTPTISYSTELLYTNDIVVGYQYNIILNGFCLKTDEISISEHLNQSRLINNIFNSNGGFIKLTINSSAILYITDIKIKSISFNESSNSWAGYIPYTVELTSNHLHLGSDVEDDKEIIERGDEDINASNNLDSPNIVNIQNHKLKTFNENFQMNVDDNIYNQIAIYNEYDPGAGYTTFINNTYFTINYTVSATGRQDITNIGGQKTTLPAWEHAKRWVHTRLFNQIAQMYTNLQFFMGVGEYGQLNNLHSSDPPPLVNTPLFDLYNEVVNFNVSESEGTFSAEYSATVKQRCTAPFNNAIGCTNSALHNITKRVNKEYRANEAVNIGNQEISIVIDGQIEGLIPAGGLAEGLKLDQLGTGSFMTFQNSSAFDKNYAAQEALNNIFDFVNYDFTPTFKEKLGINYITLQVNPETIIKPSKMTLTRNYFAGTINYSAEYNNRYNCPTSHFNITIDVQEPIPIIKEFIIPNNNINNNLSSGFSLIQKLGTRTAKKIDVTVEGTTGDDFNRCCLGTNNNWNLLAYNYFSLTDFTLPSGLVLPEISPDFVLTDRKKQMTFPDGSFTINLSYTCASVCQISQDINNNNNAPVILP